MAEPQYDQELLDIFLEEAGEVLQQLEQDLLHLEQEPDNREKIDSVFRGAHTLKGSAALTGITPVSEFAHSMEELLDAIRGHPGRHMPETYMMVLLDSLDLLKKMVEALQRGQVEETLDQAKDIKALLQYILSLEQAEPAGEGSLPDASEKGDPEPQTREGEHGRDIPAPRFRVQLNFRDDIFVRGTDPCLLLSELHERTRVLATRVHLDEMPYLEQLDPTRFFLSWSLEVESEQGQEGLQDVFVFVEDEVTIQPLGREEGAAAAQVDKEAPGSSRESREAPVPEQETIPGEATALAGSEEGRSRGSLSEAPGSPDPGRSGGSGESQQRPEVKTIRVDTERLEGILNLVAELAIAQSRLRETVRQHMGEEELRETEQVFQDVNKNMRYLQEEVMKISMVPIGGTFLRFQRMVRDLAREQGKEIDLQILGKETELDRKVIEQIADPLKHMVRNAVDHGLESPDEREAVGKPRQGHLRLNAFYEEGGIIIEIADDGKGMDLERIREKAVSRGLVQPEDELSREEILRLPFQPGFSTADQISDVSGRGVGLDVVQNNIEALRGSVELDTEKGRGTTFRIKLPLTLAIIDGMMVRVGKEQFILPISGILEFVEVTPGSIHRVTEKAPVMRIRDDYIPVASLAQCLGLDHETETKSASVEHRDTREKMSVVVQEQRKRLALLVDEIQGQEQVVIKSIAENYTQVEGVAGAAIMGDGNVAMIVDIPALFKVYGGARR